MYTQRNQSMASDCRTLITPTMPLLTTEVAPFPLHHHSVNREGHTTVIRTGHMTPQTGHMTPQADHMTPHTGHMTPHTGHMTPNTGHMTPQADHMTPHTGHMTPHTGHMTPNTGHMTPQTGHMTPHRGHMTPETCRPLPLRWSRPPLLGPGVLPAPPVPWPLGAPPPEVSRWWHRHW